MQPFSAWSTTTELGPSRTRVIDLDVPPHREAVHHDAFPSPAERTRCSAYPPVAQRCPQRARSSSGLPNSRTAPQDLA
jgi:hypothetical protein